MSVLNDRRNARNSEQKIVKSAGERISKNKNKVKNGNNDSELLFWFRINGETSLTKLAAEQLVKGKDVGSTKLEKTSLSRNSNMRV